MTMIAECPPEETFVMVLAGRSEATVASSFHRHVEQCDSCSALLRAIASAGTAAPARAVAAASVISGIRRTALGGYGAPGASTERVDLVPGARIHQYELIRELGRGGMGMVWAARDTKLGRRVAIKFLLTASRGIAERFLTEARATAQCSHDNIVIIHEVDEVGETPYMVLEFLEGQTLRDVISAFGSGEQMPPSRVIELVLPIARALARAHELGIVHRDLKPENVFVTNAGQVKVLDFGIAKALGTHERVSAGTQGEAPTLGNLTREGTMIGTLPYMSPEQMGIDEVDHRTDLWAVGIMMFEMLTGRHPIEPLTVDALITNATSVEPMPSVRALVPDLPDGLSAVVDDCLRKRKAERVAQATDLVDRLAELAPGRHGRSLAEGENPYPGLTAFQETDADRFFGRDRDVTRMVARVRELPITGVIGPSGVGKSSFIRAGVGPALKASGERWDVLTLRPGKQPLAVLAGLIERLSARSGATRDNAASQIDTVARLRAEPGYIGTVLRERARQAGGSILLFVDQLEELYTLVGDVAERRAFTSALAAIADDPAAPLRVVVSMRSDFLDRIAEDPHFMDELTRGLVFLAAPDRDGLREALVAPVEMVGHRFESAAMVEDMLEALEGAPGALPLLQFAAAKLWDARDRKRRLLTMASYNAIGGISGALATHADDVVAAMNAASQKLTQTIFRRLVTPERTRAIGELADLYELAADRAEAGRVDDQLVAARLLVVQNRGDAGGGSVEIVHESLIGRWPTLRRWLDEDQEDVAFLAQVAAAAKQWNSKGRPAGLLWRGEAMEEARHWRAIRPRELPARDRAFLDAVFALARRGQRLRRALTVGAFVLLAAIAAGASVAFLRVREANQAATENAAQANDSLAKMKEKERQRLEAEQKKAAAERQQAEAEQRQAAAIVDMHKAQTVAEQTGEDLADSREELKHKNEKLEEALVEARVAQDRAERASSVAEQKSSEVLQAKAKLEEALAEKTARVNELEREKKSLVTKLKEE